ncbi:phage tail fiber protein [Micromonospora aurantiaca (nom. illeg.)]|uniref:phage tail fiber protein n=1 Tax=Micromonospora aurantiaca (nom. illeg.) TaxID=47850 RepID=UPI00340100DE
MPAIVQAQANKILDLTLGTSSPTMFTGAAKVRLTTTAPSATAAGTELTGTGYTAGGSTISFSAASAGATTGPTSTLQWTNSSGSSWSIVGVEIWDSAGTALRWWYGTFTGQPIIVANGNIFQISIGAISVSLG